MKIVKAEDYIYVHIFYKLFLLINKNYFAIDNNSPTLNYIYKNKVNNKNRKQERE